MVTTRDYSYSVITEFINQSNFIVNST